MAPASYSRNGMRSCETGRVYLTAALSLVALLAAGCIGAVEETSTDSVQSGLMVTTSQMGENVRSVILTVSAADLPAPLQVDLGRRGGDWIVQVDGIPAGTDRLFLVVAYDGNGVALFSGSTVAEVYSDRPTVVFVLLQQVAPGGSVPVLDWVLVPSVQVNPLTPLNVSAHAHDPLGGTVTYRWTATCGLFDDPLLPAAVWTAPGTSGTDCQVTVTATSQSGGAVSQSTLVRTL